jgi:hypothetical protein
MLWTLNLSLNCNAVLLVIAAMYITSKVCILLKFIKVLGAFRKVCFTKQAKMLIFECTNQCKQTQVLRKVLKHVLLGTPLCGTAWCTGGESRTPTLMLAMTSVQMAYYDELM